MIAIPVNAKVQCRDENSAGWSTGVVINPSTERIIYLIVKEHKRPHTLRLVPVEQVIETTPQTIRLGCSTSDLAKMTPFVKTEFVEVEIPHYLGDGYTAPYFVPEAKMITVESAYYRKYPDSTIDPTNVVDEAEWESFPASDPPAWTTGRRK